MSNGKTINDLRDRLFDTIDQMRSGKLTVDRAKVISELAQTIINSAKIEVDVARLTKGGKRVPFLEGPAPAPTVTPTSTGTLTVTTDRDVLPNGVTTITRHQMRG